MSTISVPYPFVRVTKQVAVENDCAEVECWAPGVEIEARQYDDHVNVAHGMGRMLLTVISRHRPAPRYPERVFYTRKWADPDGREFGKGGLRIATAVQFERLCAGYRHEFELVEDAK